MEAETQNTQLEQEETNVPQQLQEVRQLFFRHWNEYGSSGTVVSMITLKKMIVKELLKDKSYHEIEIEKIKVLIEHIENEN